MQMGVLESVFFSFLLRGPLKTDCLELGVCVGKALCLLRCVVCLQLSLKNHVSIIICTPVRTHNRIRSPRLTASGWYNKVGKGSRQNRSVTLGKGLALRVGCKGPRADV